MSTSFDVCMASWAAQRASVGEEASNRLEREVDRFGEAQVEKHRLANSPPVEKRATGGGMFWGAKASQEADTDPSPVQVGTFAELCMQGDLFWGPGSRGMGDLGGTHHSTVQGFRGGGANLLIFCGFFVIFTFWQNLRFSPVDFGFLWKNWWKTNYAKFFKKSCKKILDTKCREKNFTFWGVLNTPPGDSLEHSRQVGGGGLDTLPVGVGSPSLLNPYILFLLNPELPPFRRLGVRSGGSGGPGWTVCCPSTISIPAWEPCQGELPPEKFRAVFLGQGEPADTTRRGKKSACE